MIDLRKAEDDFERGRDALARLEVELSEAKAALAAEPSNEAHLDRCENAQRLRDRARLLFEATETRLSQAKAEAQADEDARTQEQFTELCHASSFDAVLEIISSRFEKIIALRAQTASEIESILDELMSSRAMRARARALYPHRSEGELQLPELLTKEHAIELCREMIRRSAGRGSVSVAAWLDHEAWSDDARSKRTPTEGDAYYRAIHVIDSRAANNATEG